MPEQDACTIASNIRSRAVSAREVCAAALGRIEAGNDKLNALIEVLGDSAREQAAAIDERIAAGETVGPLAGVPIAVKDNMCLAWGKTTAASRMLESYESPYTATAVQRLIDAGAVIVGKANLDEFAMGSSCEHSFFGATRNPWDVDRVPGGSSGGSAAAVASGMVPVALGSDTGGSIRQPAGLCGIVGMKPTYGRVSRYGLIAFASSLDQIGPMTRGVRDAALVLGVISGHDPLDATSCDEPAGEYLSELDRPVEGLRIGVPGFVRSDRNHPAVSDALDAAVHTYEELGAEVVEISLPHAGHGIAAYYIVASAEASSNLARYDGVRYGRRAAMSAGDGLERMYELSRSEGFGDEVKRRVLLGTHVLSSGYYDAYYNTALKVRRLIKGDYDAAFADGIDGVLMPTSPSPAFRLGEKSGDPMELYLEDVYTVGANLAGLPGIALPGGFASVDGKELPVGVQLVGPALGEARLLRVARQFELATSFAGRIAAG